MDDKIAGDVARDRINDYGRAANTRRGWGIWRVLLYIWLGVNAVSCLFAILFLPASRVFAVIWLLLWGGILWRDVSR